MDNGARQLSLFAKEKVNVKEKVDNYRGLVEERGWRRIQNFPSRSGGMI